MIADRIKLLREKMGLTQSQLAKKLNITRSSVNAWEMGISAPSTQYIVELAKFFNITTDFLLGVSNKQVIPIDDFNDEQIEVIYSLLRYFQKEDNNLE